VGLASTDEDASLVWQAAQLLQPLLQHSSTHGQVRSCTSASKHKRTL
jgi:hypothetical protein